MDLEYIKTRILHRLYAEREKTKKVMNYQKKNYWKEKRKKKDNSVKRLKQTDTDRNREADRKGGNVAML